MPKTKDSKAIKIIRLIFSIILFLALFFLPAGTFRWTEAWILIAFYLLTVSVAILWLKKNDPGLLKERMQRKKDVKTWDRILILFYVFFLMILLIVTGLDAVRFGLSDVPLVLKVVGFLGFIPGFILGFWAMRENSYLSDMVRIQKDRGHKVCQTGPYRFVRHPMYVGVITMFFCTSLVLGSYYGLIPALLLTIIIGIRTHFEDKMLHEELPGYREYAEKTRYRIIPGIW